MNTATLSRDIIGSDLVLTGECWSCGDPATRPDGLCSDCGQIDASAVPDIHSPTWAGNTKPFEAIFEAQPSAKRVR